MRETMLNEPSYLKGIVIVHGKSELQLCSFIKSNLRLKLEIASDKKGEKSIQITSLLNFLNRSEYKTFKSFKCRFEGDLPEKLKELPTNFKIFTIMDTDDCTEKQKKEYINKDIFKMHWAYNHIVPIYNINNLEDVLVKAGVKFQKKGNKRKKEYIKIFPTDTTQRDTRQIEELSKKLAKNKNLTNMHEFFDFCLALSKQNKF